MVLNFCPNIFKFRRKLSSITSLSLRWFSHSPKYRLLFFGTDNFSLPSLKKLNENRKLNSTAIEQLEVVTSFKATVNPVRDYATTENLRLHKWTPDFAPPENFNLGLVVSFGHLLPRKLIESFDLGMLNIHASLLPKLRGASPIIHAIKQGHIETGVSLMKIKADKFDIGEILAQRMVEVGEKVRMPELHDRLAEIGASLLVDCLQDLPRYYENCWVQDNASATYAPKIDRSFTDIRWDTMTAQQVDQLFRSVYTFKPLLTTFNAELVKIYELSADDSEDLEPRPSGTIKYNKVKNCLQVSCADPDLRRRVSIFKLSIGKKKAMSAADFYNGFLSKLPVEAHCFNKKS